MTAVGLVAVVGLLVTVASTLVLRGYLTHQLDQRLLAAPSGRDEYRSSRVPDPDHDGLRDSEGPGFGAGDANGSLRALLATNRSAAGGSVLEPTPGKPAAEVALSAAQLAQLRRLPVDGSPVSLDLVGGGSYRVLARSGTYLSEPVTFVDGLPADDLENAVSDMLAFQLLLTVAGVGVAALVGHRLVRRTLKPLREVAETAHEVASLPLHTGEVGETARVPVRLTDPRTEVGQVGAALNQLLGHVEGALDERHRSELQVRQFVADASHELRTPLATIMGYAELARRSPSYDPGDALLKVEEEGVRMRGLVEDLLLLARLDSGRPLASDEVDLTKLALETVEDARVVGRGHQWTLDLPEEPVLVDGDEQRLHQVVSNLLTNARRHTPPGTTVRVGLRPEGTRAVLTVADDGPGIDPEVLGSVFERFTRADVSRTRDSGGAGLGLALVEAIVVAHDGSVGVTSHPGETVFTVSLPAA